MSLWVHLEAPGPAEPGSGIFVRESGETREITRAERDQKFPGCEPVVVRETDKEPIFSRNMTHNLAPMAFVAGIRDALWAPDDIGITQARQLIEPLTAGLATLRADPSKFKSYNPANGWGDYDALVSFVDSYLSACREYPEATVSVSR